MKMLSSTLDFEIPLLTICKYTFVGIELDQNLTWSKTLESAGQSTLRRSSSP